jgi:hypothetical protein
MSEEMKHKIKYVKPEAKDLGPVGAILGQCIHNGNHNVSGGCDNGNSNITGGCSNGNQNINLGCFWGNQNEVDGCQNGLNNVGGICIAGAIPDTSGMGGRSPIWP